MKAIVDLPDGQSFEVEQPIDGLTQMCVDQDGKVIESLEYENALLKSELNLDADLMFKAADKINELRLENDILLKLLLSK